MEKHHHLRWKRGMNAICADQGIMSKWADGMIEADEAAARMNRENEWKLEPEEFVELAESLGYRRFVKWNALYEKWVPDKKALQEYEERKAAERAKKQADEAYEEIAKAVKYV